jgi:hypothetical protein
MPEFHYHGNEITEFEGFTDSIKPHLRQPTTYEFPTPAVHSTEGYHNCGGWGGLTSNRTFAIELRKKQVLKPKLHSKAPI